jgi:TolA-binding protein
VVHDVREDLSPLAGIDDVVTLFKAGMVRYDAGDYAGARVYFAKILRARRPNGDDAAFFYAASFFRQAEWARARHEFKRLIQRYPKSHWVPAAYWHIAMCDLGTGHRARARRGFADVIRRFPNDTGTVAMVRGELDRM